MLGTIKNDIHISCYQDACYLAQTKQEQKKLLDLYYNNDRIIGVALYDYTKELRQQGRGCVGFVEIEKAYNNNNTDELKLLLNELFLEYINDRKISVLNRYIEKYNVSLKDVYNYHSNNTNVNFISCVKRCVKHKK